MSRVAFELRVNIAVIGMVDGKANALGNAMIEEIDVALTRGGGMPKRSPSC